MNREIQELREVITKLVPLLTGKGLKVTQRGSQAYVKANPKTNKPEVVNIPSIPDTASMDFINAVAGFVDHEVAHVLFTDWKFYGGDGIQLDKFSVEGQALVNTHNIVEDTFIEREIVKTFPGAEHNLDRLHRHFLEKITTPALASAKGDEKAQFNYLIVPMMRALSGQEQFKEFMDKNDYWKNPMVEMLHMAMSDEALELIKKAKTTKDTLEVAQEIHDILFNNKKKDGSEAQPKQQPPQQKKSKSQDKPEKQAGEGDGDGERKHGDDDSGSPTSGDEGPQGQGEAGQSGNSKSSVHDEDEGEAESDESAGAAGDKDESSEDESEEGSSSEDESEDEKEAEADGESDGEADGESDDEADGESDGDEAEGDGKSDGDEADGESEGAGSSEGDEKENYLDNEGGQTGGDDEEHQGGGGVGGDAGKSMFDLDPADFKPMDLSSAISKEISDMAVKSIAEADYSTFTKDEDKIEPLQVDDRYVKDDWVPTLEEKVGSLVGPMQKDIERLMASQSLTVRTAGHRSGRLHSASLHRVLQNDPKVFQRKQEHNSKDTAVTLLVDNSGSMHGSRIIVAMQAAYALGQTLERVGIASEILGFTTGSLSASARQQVYDEHRKGIYFCRTDTIVMPIFKSFSERMTPTVKKRIAYQINVQSGMNTNIDGESIEYAAQRLIPRRERRKVMMVMSDGQPVGQNTGWHLKNTVDKLNKMGVETVGIGIQSNAVQHFYDRSMVLNKIEDLPAAVMGELRRILSK